MSQDGEGPITDKGINFQSYPLDQLQAIALQLYRSPKVKQDLCPLMVGTSPAGPSSQAMRAAEESQYASMNVENDNTTNGINKNGGKSSPKGLKQGKKEEASFESSAFGAGEEDDNDDASDFLEKARFVPMRLTYEERKYLRLVESAMLVSTYTDRVDFLHAPGQEQRKLMVLMKQMCSVLSGLLIAHDYNSGQELMKERDFQAYAIFFQTVFEISRRYKILNPERMRAAYGKLMYVLQDSSQEQVADLLNFECATRVKTVFHVLSKSARGLELLKNPLLRVATSEIVPGPKDYRWDVQRKIQKKEAAIKKLSEEYSSGRGVAGRKRSSGRGGRKGSNWMRYIGLRSSHDSDDTDSDADDGSEGEGLSEDLVQQCIYSLGDHNTYLRFNREPCDKLIAFLTTEFSSTQASEDPRFSLSIEAGQSGARLSHSHARQYAFVHQSLMLWRDVLDNMFQLWHLAEQDLLNTKDNPYTLTNTGQGLNRVQNCPRVAAAMKQLVEGVQRKVGGWIGSAQIHLGDHNVPNGLMFIDKYTQVPRILGPVVLCLEKIVPLYEAHPTSTSGQLIDSFGGPFELRKLILADFFRHAFDGSGADNFFDAGSCVDGRLTSAWNWCSRIHEQPYYPIFLLTGFSGFDGKEGW